MTFCLSNLTRHLPLKLDTPFTLTSFSTSVKKLNALSVGHGSNSKSVGRAGGSNGGFEVWGEGGGG